MEEGCKQETEEDTWRHRPLAESSATSPVLRYVSYSRLENGLSLTLPEIWTVWTEWNEPPSDSLCRSFSRTYSRLFCANIDGNSHTSQMLTRLERLWLEINTTRCKDNQADKTKKSARPELPSERVFASATTAVTAMLIINTNARVYPRWDDQSRVFGSAETRNIPATKTWVKKKP